MKNILIVINPRAGKGKALEDLSKILLILSEKNFVPKVMLTQKDQEKVMQLIASQSQGIDTVICLGGDGTLNIVMNAVMRLEEKLRPSIGYIPKGTTNDFAKTLELSTDASKATRQFLLEEKRSMDVGTFNDEYFAYIASFGTFTSSSYDTKQARKNTLGHLSYVLSGVKELTNIHEYDVTIETEDEKITGQYIFGSVSNSTSIGGVVNLNKKYVDVSDGLFEVILIKMPKNLLELTAIINALASQKLTDTPLIDVFQTGSITFNFSESVNWSLDGEKSKRNQSFRIENLRQQVTILDTNA